jgi:hypothetical protein
VSPPECAGQPRILWGRPDTLPRPQPLPGSGCLDQASFSFVGNPIVNRRTPDSDFNTAYVDVDKVRASPLAIHHSDKLTARRYLITMSIANVTIRIYLC